MLFTIQEIINTLNSIEVHGRDNLDRLLGAIMALEVMAEAEKDEGSIELPPPTGKSCEESAEETENCVDEG